ncbi:MAG TPA: hypothetical protein VGL91_22600 [Acidobacteriota bacterium]|jgi:hypothetical protein
MMQDKQIYNDQLLTSYLLGSLSDEKTERLDELSIADDEFAGRLSEVENDLADAYVRGELSGHTLEKFKSFYMLSPKRHEKVRFAESLLAFKESGVAVQAKDAQAPAPASSRPSRESTQHFSRLPFFPAPRTALQWAFAAALVLMLVGGGYLVFENLRLRNQMTQTEAERTGLEQREKELQRQLAQQRSAEAETVKELARVGDRLAQIEEQLTANRQSGKVGLPSREPGIVSFALLPQTRGAGQIAAVAVPAQTDYVILQLQLESDDFPGYQVALRNPANNQIVWRSGKLKAKSGGTNKAVSITLPGNLLKQQNYTLDVTGIPASGAAEFISSYPFRVVIQ